jgi:hypothetical protein
MGTFRDYPHPIYQRLGRYPLSSLGGVRPGLYPHAGFTASVAANAATEGFLCTQPAVEYAAHFIKPATRLSRKQLHGDPGVFTGRARGFQYRGGFLAR